MAKLLKITGRAFGIILEWVLIFVILFLFAVRSSPVQTYLAEQATAYLSEELNTTVKVDRISIIFFSAAVIEGFLVLDQQGDTLASAESIYANVNDLDIFKRSFKLKNAEVDKLFLHVQKEVDGTFNHQFIKDYFTKPKKKKKDIYFTLDEGIVTNGRFRYDDYTKPVKTNYGIDYFHIATHNINGAIEEMTFIDHVFTGQIKEFSCKEKSGFELKDLVADASVSSGGVFLNELTLETERSKIKSSKFNLLSDTYTSFKYFVDSVEFDARLSESNVNLDDVAYFASALKGMNDNIRLSARLSQRVPNLRISDFDLRYRERTQLQGTINLTDYRNFMEGDFHEKLNYAFVDFNEIEELRLPDASKEPYLVLNEKIKRLGHFETEDILLKGKTDKFVLSASVIHTDLGAAQLINGIEFTKDEQTGGYKFMNEKESNYDVKFYELQLGTLINKKEIGILDGSFAVRGLIKPVPTYIDTTYVVEFDAISGNVKRFDYLDYSYKGITIHEGEYRDQQFTGKVDVKEDNLDLTYDGFIDFKENQHMVFTIDIADAFLDNLNFSERDSWMRSKFVVDIHGKTANSMYGKVHMDGFVYNREGKNIHIPSLDLLVKRTDLQDEFIISSSIVSGKIVGKVDFSRVIDDFKYQFAQVFPSLMRNEKIKSHNAELDEFSYDLTFHNTEEVLHLFFPDLTVEGETSLKGYYSGKEGNFNVNLEDADLTYKGVKFKDVSFNQIIDSVSVLGTYYADQVIFNDSLKFYHAAFETKGGKDDLYHTLRWEGEDTTSSLIAWHTTINDWNDYKFLLEPSYFYITDHRWDIAHESTLRILGDTIAVDYFELTRNNQLVLIDGIISSKRSDHLNFKVNDFEIEEISKFITSDYPMKGKLNGWGYLSDPFNQIEYVGDASLIGFHVKGREVGDIFIQSDWDSDEQSISARGDLIYKGNQTFDFDGHYYLDREYDPLDFRLNFDYTDIQFVNAFLDPDILSDIRGILVGGIQVCGTIDKPTLSGIAELESGSAYVDLLGVHFGVDGPIEIDNYGFYMNNIPVFDEEGNAGYLIGSVYHDDFTNFNFDLQFDLERDAINKDPLHPWKVVPLKKFLLLNAAYTPDQLFYGKGYGTGDVNIFGYTENLEITVNLQTQKGTKVNVPMYGIGELDEENDFIVFQDTIADTTKVKESLFDFSGVDLDLNFDVTEDAELKIVFDEQLGDELEATGSGDISIRLDNFGNVRMDGLYTVEKGIYHFAMRPIEMGPAVKERFFIEKGGTINWTGDPYNANLNLKTYYKTQADVSDISQDLLASEVSRDQPILCYLNLTESLLRPTIEFDIKAPQASDVDRQLIMRVTSDQDELNRQFFSLLIYNRFQPLAGTERNASAAANLITNQINSILSTVSDEYRLNVNYDNDFISGDKQYEFGFSTGFLDERLILSGSFGVETYTETNVDENQNELIGDINLEYLLNETGTFRVNIFNESTDKSVIIQNDLGKFTQGAGLTYKEDFNSFRDFKLIQAFLDLFRRKDKRKVKRDNERRPVPKDSGSIELLKPEEIECS